MNAAVAVLTFRQLLGKRRTLVLSLFALIPIALALVFLARGERDPAEWTARILLGQIVAGTLLPLAALVFGTAALGSEIEDGTAVYLLAKPVPRRSILAAKLFSAWAVTVGFVATAGIVGALISVQGADESGRIIVAFAIAITAGALVYSCVFVALSLLTTRAFIAGLIYVFVWEGIVTRLFTGTRIFSVRQYTLGLAGLIGDLPTRVFNPDLGGTGAIVGMLIVGTGATWLAVRRLQRFQVGEAG